MTTYQAALNRARKAGAGQCDDAALMALFCRDTIQHLLGAVGPQLIWEGAQQKNLTALELHDMCHSDPAGVEALQWL